MGGEINYQNHTADYHQLLQCGFQQITLEIARVYVRINRLKHSCRVDKKKIQTKI